MTLIVAFASKLHDVYLKQPGFSLGFHPRDSSCVSWGHTTGASTSETQACKDGSSHMIYLGNMLCEALYPEYRLIRRGSFLRKLCLITVVDC